MSSPWYKARRVRAHQLGLAGEVACSLAIAFVWVQAGATPRVPANDAEVLENVPSATATRQLEPLRRRLAAHSEDVPTAVALAQGYLDIGRANGDPRLVSYAQAVLDPWVARKSSDVKLLIVAADVRQYLHQFEPALVLLDRALSLEPSNGEAWLTKATLLQVQGHFDAARAACRHLVRSAGQLIALTCLSSVDSLTGKLPQSYSALRNTYDDDGRLPGTVRVWVLDELGDMASRAADQSGAERFLRAALSIVPTDPYTKAALADVLLLQGRDSEVIELLRNDEAQDNLLLRLALATRRADTQAGRRWANMFQERYEAARRDGDSTHLREQARFVLDVRNDPKQALALSVRNWQVQREPADVRVYAAAAMAAYDADALRTIKAWMRVVHYEDHTLNMGESVASGIP